MKIRCAPVRNKGARAVDTRQLAIDRAEIIPRDNRRRAFNREPPSCDLRDGDLSALKFRTKIRRLNFYFASLPPENGQIIKPITERGVARARARALWDYSPTLLPERPFDHGNGIRFFIKGLSRKAREEEGKKGITREEKSR